MHFKINTIKKASIRVVFHSETKKNCIENSFFDPKSYSRYTSSYGRSTRIDEFGIQKYQNAQQVNFYYVIHIIYEY